MNISEFKIFPSPTSVQYNHKVSQYGVFAEDYQGDLKASLAGGVCNYPRMYFVYRPYVFAYVTKIKSTYLLTY